MSGCASDCTGLKCTSSADLSSQRTRNRIKAHWRMKKLSLRALSTGDSIQYTLATVLLGLHVRHAPKKIGRASSPVQSSPSIPHFTSTHKMCTLWRGRVRAVSLRVPCCCSLAGVRAPEVRSSNGAKDYHASNHTTLGGRIRRCAHLISLNHAASPSLVPKVPMDQVSNPRTNN